MPDTERSAALKHHGMEKKSAFFSSHPTGVSNSWRGGATGGELSQNGEASSPASPSTQRPLAKRKCARERKADTCAICMGPVEDRGFMLKRLSCGTYTQSCAHAHCFTCVMTWSERTNTCPMCKERFHAVRHKHGVRPFGAGGETVEVKDRDPTADCSSEDENLAAMLAFGDDSDLEEGGEEHETSQEVSHGYNVDGFVVHDDDAAEEGTNGRDQDWQEGGASAQRTRSGRGVGDSDRTRRQIRVLRRSERVGEEAYFSEREGGYRQTRGQGIRARRNAGVETRTRATRTTTRGGGGGGRGLIHSLVDSDDGEVEVLPDELRQLQREAARVIGDSPLRPRRRPPQVSRPSRYPRRSNSATVGFRESSARSRRDRNSNAATSDGSQSGLETARGSRGLNSRRAVSTLRLTRSSIEEKVDDDVEGVGPRSDSPAATRRQVEARSPVEVAASSRWAMLEEHNFSSAVVNSAGTTNSTRLTAAVSTRSSVSNRPVAPVGRAARLPAAPQWGAWISRRPSSSIDLAGRLPWQSPAESFNARTGELDRVKSAGQRRVLRDNDNARLLRSAAATASTALRQGTMRDRLATRGAFTTTSSDNDSACRQSARISCSSGGGNVGLADGKDEVPVVCDVGGEGENSGSSRNAGVLETTGRGEDSSRSLEQSVVGQGIAHRMVGRKQDEEARFRSDAGVIENRRNQGEEEQEEEFEWRVEPAASRIKRPRAAEPEEEEGEEDEEDEFDCFMTGASLPTKDHQAKEKSEGRTGEGSAREDLISSRSPAQASSSSRLVQNRHRQLADSTDAKGSGGFGGGRNARRRLTTVDVAETKFASSSLPSPSPASSSPSRSSHRGFGLREPLQCGMETEEIGLKDRLFGHRQGCSRTGRGNTQNEYPPVFANADALSESGDIEPSSVGRVEGDTRGAAGKGVLFDGDDDESSPVGRVGRETRGAARKGQAGCDWRRAQSNPQHGRGRSSNVPSAHVSSHFSVGFFDKFRFTGARA